MVPAFNWASNLVMKTRIKKATNQYKTAAMTSAMKKHTVCRELIIRDLAWSELGREFSEVLLKLGSIHFHRVLRKGEFGAKQQ